MRRAARDLLIGALFSALSGLALRALAGAKNALPASTAASRITSQAPFPALSAAADSVASYDIDAKLDTNTHRITAHETIHFVNRSAAPLNELWFHLYLNAFKNDKTLFLRSPFGAGRSGDKAHAYGYVDVKKLSVLGDGAADGRDLWPDRDRHSPNDPDDETDLRLPLPNPLAPGATLSIDLTFEDQLPEIVERTGYSGSFHFLGQWFPKLARLEPDGKFAHFSFHALSEFYADFGDYDVSLDVPEAFRVGATGSLSHESHAAGRKQLRFLAENVHDFAWTAWDRFETRSERIAGVNVSVLFPPHQERNAQAELDSVRFALPHFNALYGTYPYPTLTLVHPPDGADNAGGMEYPTLITTGGPWYATFGGGHFIDIVTIHELGHQWFYGLVASNEHVAPFLDEGLNSYAEAEAMEARYGAGAVFDGFGLSVTSTALNRALSAARGADEPVGQSAADFASFRSLGALVYSRTAIVMATIGRVYGEDRLAHAVGMYTRRFRFRHPSPDDFLGVMQEELGAEAATALSAALFARGTVDYLVREISNAPEPSAAGIFDGPSGRQQKKPDPPHAPGQYAGRVVVYRHGTLELPVDIELIFEDGSRERRHWDGHGFTHNVDYAGPSQIVAVNVDPEHRILLDDDFTNNWHSTTSSPAPRVFERGLYAAQVLLGEVGP
ncbi:MAG: M1 family metallopeptidase [Polyangiaceae bacterium]